MIAQTKPACPIAAAEFCTCASFWDWLTYSCRAPQAWANARMIHAASIHLV